MIGSLFSGIGGLELGLELAGLGPVAWQVESDPFARGVLAMHWPNANRSVIDVRQASAANLVPVDLICGGSPCQNISDAGDRTGIDGEQSGLWREMSRIIGELRPRFVVWENVAAAVSRGMDRVVADLVGHGYRCEGRIIGADDVGAPHRRKRLFVVAYTGGERGTVRDRSEGADERQAPSERDPHVAHGDSVGQREQRETRLHALGSSGNDAPRRREALSDADAEPLRVERQRVPGRRSGDVRARGYAEPRHDRSGGGRSPESRMGRSVDGLPDWLHRWPSGPGDAPAVWEPARAVKVFAPTWGDRLAALGNAVVPACAYQVGLRVREIEDCA